MNEITYSLFVGVDWGTEAHQVCVLAPDGQIVEERKVSHSATAVTEFLDWLSTKAPQCASVAVAIETPHGAVVEELLARNFRVFAINPKQLDRFRDRYFPAGAKDDRKDAMVLASSLRTDRHCFRSVGVSEPLVVRLRALSRLDEDLNLCFQRHCSQLRQLLHRYFHHLLQLSPTADEPWVWALLELAPTPDRAAQLTLTRIEKVLRQCHIRRIDAGEILNVFRGPTFSLAPGTIDADSEHAIMLLPHLRLLHQQRLDVGHRIDRILEELSTPNEKTPSHSRDVELLFSLPGVGRLVTATLLAEAAPLLAERDYQGLRAYAGVAPVTRQSGKKAAVLMRYGCNLRLRNALYHWSRVSVQRDPRSREHYHRLRNKGHSHGRALRGIGDRLLALMCAMLRSQTLYDPSRRKCGANP
jgi:transposase